jgi:tRNA/tmRNA/rRNA uracil-C5-methylase (TrmA/RlmC/RlmD family)
MYRHRSHDVLPLREMPLASPELDVLALLRRHWPAGSRITAVAPVGGDRPLVLVDGVPWTTRGADRRPTARASVRETAEIAGRTYSWRVAGTGFWQVHRAAPTVLGEAVLDAVGERPGGAVLDLYAGAGLFTALLADAVGPDGRVLSVEGDARAVRDARRSLHGVPQVELREGDVRGVLGAGGLGRPDVVVLDPPRVGAGRQVVEAVAAAAGDRVVYVACDPAPLARDLATFAGLGWGLTSLRALDLFPMTHHVECVAVLDR